jgi:DNA-binding response OmpR family regulator
MYKSPDVDENIVLVVMDRTDYDAKLIASTLTRAGFEVRCCADSTSVLELCCSVGLQLAIIDPGTPGIAIPELLRGMHADVPVLLLADPSLLDSEPDWVGARNIRATLTKPFRRSQLLGSVLKVVNEPRYCTA